VSVATGRATPALQPRHVLTRTRRRPGMSARKNNALVFTVMNLHLCLLACILILRVNHISLLNEQNLMCACAAGKAGWLACERKKRLRLPARDLSRATSQDTPVLCSSQRRTKMIDLFCTPNILQRKRVYSSLFVLQRGCVQEIFTTGTN
jgi:hypothetical protein